MSKSESMARVSAAYLLAFGTATAWLVWGPSTDRLWLDGLIADVIATVIVFGASRWHGNSSFYDPYWSVLPPYLAVYWVVASDAAGDPWRIGLALTVVFVWAVRLTANWVTDFPGLHHEDWRYPMLRDGAGRWELPVDFLAIHLVPTFQTFLGTLPVYFVATRAGRDVGWLDVVATAVGLGAALLQLVADGQMRRFIRDRQPGEAMDRGLWAWSRHPNYFGEINFWFSLCLFGLAAAPEDWWWQPIGTVAMVAMFLGASIPMMEKRSLERRPSYQQVIDRVPMLVPRPPRRPRA